MTGPLTHWCRQCDAHYRINHVRHCIPAPNPLEGEVEVNICPVCSSYEIEELQEVTDEQ